MEDLAGGCAEALLHLTVRQKIFKEDKNRPIFSSSSNSCLFHELRRTPLELLLAVHTAKIIRLALVVDLVL
jgi:hypothetical protein